MIEFMPFGKYKNQPIASLPDHYIRWLLTIEIDPKRYPYLAEAIENEWSNRENRASAGDRQLQRGVVVMIPADHVDSVREIVRTGYHTLSFKKHPDHGGNHNDMQELNDIYDSLCSQLQR